MRFVKMQGCGNDYIYVNGFEETIEDPGALSRRMSAPHFGVGADGLILVLPSDCADFRMRMFNADGSEGTMCGNGARCVGRFVHEQGLTDKTEITLETGGGIRTITLGAMDEDGWSVCVDMGKPQVRKEETDHEFVSMGNGNCIYAINEDPFAWADFDTRGGPLCARYDANIIYAQVLAPDRIRMRVYERGSGETLACGSGACAAVVSLHGKGACANRVSVQMRGGTLDIAINEHGHVLMTGPAQTVYTGEWPNT